MENASKALIMAGSILMSVLVIGVLVLLYNQISSLEQTKVDSETTVKVVEYLKKFEQYADKSKTYYGSDILSLANLQEEYNLTQAEEKGYQRIEIKVKINRRIEPYFNIGNFNIEVIETNKSNLESAIKTSENSIIGDRAISYYANKSYKEIALIYGVKDHSKDEILSASESQVYDWIQYDDGEAKELYDKINNYKTLKSDYTSFKSKKFELNTVQYNNTTGRLTRLEFSEV